MRKLVLAVAMAPLLSTALAQVAHSQPYGPVFRVEYATDRAGSDLRAGFESSYIQCQNTCAYLGNCKAFTWVERNQQPPNYNNARPLCWLKNAVPGPRKNEGMITGVKR